MSEARKPKAEEGAGLLPSRYDAGDDAYERVVALRDRRTARQTKAQKLLCEHFGGDIDLAAIDGLASTRPGESANRLLSKQQIALFAGILSVFAAAAWRWPLAVFTGFNIFVTLYFISAIFFRVWLLLIGRKIPVDEPPQKRIADVQLPVITILLPLYRDAAALPALAQAIDRLDYPAHKKDVKLLLEEDDPETVAEVRKLGLDRRYEIVTIPPLGPRTKPKACNYGLYLAGGELIVIYDAEDLPEPEQLRKAAERFAEGDARLACVQARLNYYNREDNWLTRLFTLEYSLWFDWLLPALERMGAPIPLGGTSNFFRTDILAEIGGWDPYNVTEDADLGLRLARLGYRVEVMNSTTFEEANCRLDNWMRQRSRWLKGYLQTWLVHMREPQRIIATTGWRGFLAVQLFVAGNVFSAVVNPVMWTGFLIWVTLHPPILDRLFPPPVLYLNLFALVFGNLVFVLLMAIAPLKRGWRGLAPYGATAPAYWLLSSAAAYKALHQAVFRPHYWEKTDHVISAAARRKREDALKTHF